ncbi:zeta toxin family protein [Bifidobacterium felsineum]|uniref:zeta toxin family protein n=1 Tax=Bifidobacterium felsineum TaxID=2045440 RepID=UPI001BDCA096|nr:zeta toxin family protein [Bifidobacterium felsineum]MBT1164655.1 zeta toxin family protein [Bifidobacterium felsineum]
MSIPDEYLIDDQTIDLIFDNMIRPAFYDSLTVKATAKPTTVYLGGQPGAGKSRTRAAIAEQYGEIAQIDPDVLRTFHPAFKTLEHDDPSHMAEYTNPFAGAMVDRSVAFCKKNGIDYIIEGTWRNPEAMATWMKRDHDAGRKVHAVAMAVPPALSAASTEARYFDARHKNSPARWTNIDYFSPLNRDMPDFVRAVACNRLTDRFTVADRTGLIPESDRRGNRTRLALPYWTTRFDRPLTVEEIGFCERVMDDAERMLAHDSPEYAESRRIRSMVEQAITLSRQASDGNGSETVSFVPASTHAGLVWVNPYVRGDGTAVSGYWQDRS